MQHKYRFVICAAGIFISFFYFAILQEKIMKGKYSYDVVNSDGTTTTFNEKYTYVLALVFLQCTVSFFFAKGILTYWKQGEDKTPYYYYGSSALMYLLAMICSNMALQWVPYPTQVVGKAAKPIPVMILGVLVGKKSYAAKKYLFVFLIVVGVCLFMYKDRKSASTQEASFGLGELLLLLSLTMDGLLGAVQERMRANSKPSGQQMMKGMNMWASAMTGIAFLVTGEVFKFVEFVGRYPYVLSNLALLSLTGTVGQLFIYMMVSEFGPLSCSVVTTTRKFFTVLASVIIFGNVLIERQWIGAVLVFTGLFLDAFFAKGGPPKKKNDNMEELRTVSISERDLLIQLIPETPKNKYLPQIKKSKSENNLKVKVHVDFKGWNFKVVKRERKTL